MRVSIEVSLLSVFTVPVRTQHVPPFLPRHQGVILQFGQSGTLTYGAHAWQTRLTEASVYIVGNRPVFVRQIRLGGRYLLALDSQMLLASDLLTRVLSGAIVDVDEPIEIEVAVQ